jgi:hypothetical protein
MDTDDVILMSHPINIDLDGKALLKQRRSLKQQLQQLHSQQHHDDVAEAATATPRSKSTHVKTKRSGSWQNQVTISCVLP